MRQRLTVILTFVVIIGLLVIINTLSHVQEDDSRDLEFAPNRSTYHSGPTGVRALHDFLNESGYKVMRWREPPAKLLGRSGDMVSTLVVVGDTRVPFEEEEIATFKRWVMTGGRLVVVDRTPDPGLLITDTGWAITITDGEMPGLDINPSDVTQMTKDVSEVKPVQPTLVTSDVESVMPSRFATRFVIAAPPKNAPVRVSQYPPGQRVVAMPSPTPEDDEEVWAQSDELPEESPPPAVSDSSELIDDDNNAPVAHVGDATGALVVDYAYGHGHVILMSDPYVVANGGIVLKDNLVLAINMLGGPQTTGLIAFDEYHQGRGINRNEFASYFAGTPVLPIAGQLVLLVLVVLWTNGRRFARPLPLPQVDRRSSLEFVASMAELQERSRAFDLAIENIYTRTRRVLARHAGVDYNSSRSEIAQRIAARSTIDRNKLETLMRQCEEAINGEPITPRQSIHLVKRLREVERLLGLRMRSRDVRQAAENI